MASSHSLDEPQARPEPAAAVPTRVLYIGGEGRSGSTVLEKALAAHPDVVAVGELKYLWRWGIKRNELCACGNPVPECVFWSAVGRRLFGPDGFASEQAAAALSEYEVVAANRRMLASFLTPILPSSRRRLARVRDFLGDLYAAIAAEAGASVVVDASKHPMHLSVVFRASAVDLRVVQLVRDPCGVTNSWSKKVALPHDPTGTRTMGPHPASVVVPRWALMNLAVQYIRLLRTGIVVRYEDFCREPRETIARILRLAELDPALVPDTGTDAIVLTAGHGIAGNPARFGADEITVTEDTAWRSAVPRAKRLAIKTAVLPQVIQYRYLGRR
ncbi:MAG: sulfotransferase [Actinomycetota bacterium]